MSELLPMPRPEVLDLPAAGPIDLPIEPLDLRRTFALQALGRFDPSAALTDEALVKRFVHRGAVVELVARRSPRGLRIEGPDAALALWRPALPPEDGYESFSPEHPLLRRLHVELPGARVLPVPWLFDVACGAILQQRVAFEDACRQWAALVSRLGRGGAFPGAGEVAAMAPWHFVQCGVDPRRARALIALGREERRHPFLSLATPRPALRSRLRSIPGIGPWTTEMILGFGAGDPDALVLGDLTLPRLVGWALAREPRADDARMLELLAPYAGQRFRVCRLLLAANLRPPR